jgi:hypothetical protein
MSAPTSSGIITGRNGSLTFHNLPSGTEHTIEIKDWKLSRKNKISSAANSGTAGYQETTLGIYSWSISFTAILPLGDMTIYAGLLEGTIVTLTGKTGSTSSGSTFTGNARIESIEEAVPIDGGELAATVNAIGDKFYNFF